MSLGWSHSTFAVPVPIVMQAGVATSWRAAGEAVNNPDLVP